MAIKIVTSRTDPRDLSRATPINLIPISLEELPADYCKLKIKNQNNQTRQSK